MNDSSSRNYNNKVMNASVSSDFSAPSAKVLVVDDVITNLEVAKIFLSKYDIQVNTALSGAEAIKSSVQNDYDIVFMDNWMPEMSGIEAVAKIRALGFNSLIIIALSGTSSQGAAEQFLQSGMNDFMEKPIRADRLHEILLKWLPAEKIITSASKKAAAAETADFTIEGLDTKAGICLTGGTLERYIDTLGVFAKDTKERIEEIKTCFAQRNTHLLTTHVHALKSVSASIGASEPYMLAKKLEAACIKDDWDYINANTDNFINKLAQILDRINECLPKEEAETISGYDRHFVNLKEALLNMNMSAIDVELDILPDGKEVKKIKECVLLFEYDEAIQIIDKILQNEGK